jgi:hypothetical protein
VCLPAQPAVGLIYIRPYYLTEGTHDGNVTVDSEANHVPHGQTGSDIEQVDNGLTEALCVKQWYLQAARCSLINCS